MPWSNQGGGGPWGSGPKGPWGSGPQLGGSTPPILEDLLRRSQDKLKNLLPGGGMGTTGFILLGMAAIALWFFSGFFGSIPAGARRGDALRKIRAHRRAGPIIICLIRSRPCAPRRPCA